MNAQNVENIISKLFKNGFKLDLEDPNLKDTPARIAKMYCKEFLSGITDTPPNITAFPNEEKYDEIIMLDNIPFVSLCSHHFLPFQGIAWFLYIPKDKLCGASKVPRLIDFYSHRPQLQERLTQQIVKHFISEIDPLGVMLIMRAVHGCMACRGIKTGNHAGLMTSKVYGSFKENDSARNEALQMIQMSIKL